MKFFLAFAAVVAVAVAGPVQRELIAPGPAGPTPVVQEPIAIGPAILETSPISVGPAIIDNHPISVGPAIIDNHPISVGPAIIESNPISVGPAIIDFPLPDGGAVEEAAVIPAPAVIEPVAAAESSPLVQIIINVNQASADLSPIAVGPAIIEQIVEEPHVPGPVNIVDNVIAPDVILEPIQVVEPIVPGPVNVVDNVVIEPIQVVEPIVVEPVIVGTPIIPEPAVVLPDTLN